MALREILTHHGGAAGVLTADSSDGALHLQFKDQDYSNAIKREREIDLNMQVSAMDELEPSLKKIKVEDEKTLSVENMVYPVKCNDDSFNINVKVEDTGYNLPAHEVNGQLNLSSVKVEPESNLDSVSLPSKEAVDVAEFKDVSEEKRDRQNLDVLNNLPDNSEMMNWVKLARHSWQKNCEFLQDCAIRFLCILSLDRFVTTFILLVFIHQIII